MQTNLNRIIHRYGADVRLIHNSWSIMGGIKINDWGVYDYHRDHNLTFSGYEFNYLYTEPTRVFAATLNAAWALGLQAEVGSLAPGKAADFLVLDGPDYRLIPYRAGHDPVASVFKGGQRVIPQEITK